MGKKLNTLTQEQAEKIWDGRPKLPEKKILTFAHKQVFVNEQYFFKHKECGHRYGYCTACGKDVQIDIENMRLWTDKHAACRSARHNDTVCCPACGHEVQVKDAGRGRSQLVNAAVVAVAQRTRNGGILLSFVRVYEDYTHDFKAVPEVGRLLYAAYFNIGQHFVADRDYFCGGMSISVKQKPTRKLPCTVEPVKLNHNNWQCTEGEGAKLLGFEEALEKSNLRYLPWEAYHECAQQLHRSAIANYPVNLLGLLYQYSRYPVLTERLIKEDNGDLVAEQVEWNCTAGLDYKQVVPYKAMRLTKPEYRMLQAKGVISSNTLKATAALKKYGCKMTDKNILFFLAFQYTWSQRKCYKALDVLRQNLSPQKAINWVNRQAAGYGTTTNVLSDYSDYLDQCRRLGLDVNRKEVAVPQNLRDLHRQYSEELTRRANEKKAKEQAERANAAPDPAAIRKEAEKEAAKEYKAKLATAKADAEKKTKAALEKLEQEKADLKRQLDSSATKLDAAVRQAKAAGADTDVAACRVYFTELQQTAAKVQELIGKINAKDPATGAKLSAAVIQVLQSTARNLEVAQ